MLDHVTLRTPQFERLAAFYEAALAPLGASKMMAFDDAAGFGRDAMPTLWLGASTEGSPRTHVAITAPSRAAVDAFYAAALAAGATDNGPPGLREYGPNYYAAFVYDPDGNNLEAVCHAAE
jgi:catechol 2,3-dioxygenase-like lactoylglutathione lyase family enzyme